MKIALMPSSVGTSDLVELLEDLERGYKVTATQVRAFLTADERRNLKAQMNHLSREAPPKKLPLGLETYADLVRKADQLHQRPKSGNPRRWGPHLKARFMPINSADQAYERALEYLEQLLGEFPGARVWLDRDVSFNGQSSGQEATIQGIPRLHTSRSEYSLQYGARKNQMAAVLLNALRTSTAYRVGVPQTTNLVNGLGRRAFGISQVPVDPDARDEYIFAYGEWRTI